MTEHVKSSGEHGPELNVSPEAKRNLERLQEQAESASKGERQNLPELQEKAKQAAESAAQVSVGEKRQDAGAQPAYSVQRELKAEAYTRSLQRIRSQLKPAQQTFSKVVHQPLVETLSNAGAQTVARPSGLLGGGFMALLGSGGLLYMSKHYGFSYNFFVFFLFFAGGFIVGLLGELLLRALFRKKA